MSVDLELTLKRLGFRRISENKLQIACLRIAWWNVAGKHSISFEVNWRT
jgi:hypothetical protein